MIKPAQLQHLTAEEHARLGQLMKTAEEALFEAQRIVQRAPFADETHKVAQRIQLRLREPLFLAWDARFFRDGRDVSPYPSVHYA
jgi:hypothetical protein